MTKSVFTKLSVMPLIIGLFAVLWAPLPAFSQTTAAPAAGAKYLPTEWSKRCFKQGGKTVCLTLIDRYAARADGQPIWLAAAALREVQGEKNKAFTVRVPLGVYLQNGLIYSIDKGKAQRVPFSVCIRQGCQAIFPATPALLKSLKTGGEFRMQLTGGNGKNIQISLTLKGFTKAYNGTPVPAPAQASGQAQQPTPKRKSTKGDAPAN
ncbi:MAG: invasion associated locus B family protein [Alphaproteobacteria bacterium]